MPIIQSVLTSCGYGPAPPPAATITVDVRELLHDPHIDPTMRSRAGADTLVRDRVMSTPGVARLIANLADTVLDLLEDAGDPNLIRVDVAIGCVGGRHRSVVLIDMLAHILTTAGIGVEVEHRDAHRPVLDRSTS